MRAMTWRVAWACVFTLSVHAGAASAFRDEPKGFGEAELGMSVAQVRAQYPEIQERDASALAGELPGVTIYLLANQRLEGLPGPVEVVLQFFKDRLWVVHVRYLKNETDAVVQVLTQRHGEPDVKDPGPQWNGDDVLVAVVPGDHLFKISSRSLTAEVEKEAQKAFPAPPTPTPKAEAL